MRKMFHGMPNEPVTLIKKNGQRFENLPAIVQSKIIFTEDPKIPIEDGDEFERRTPSGVVEVFTVEDAGFFPGMSGMAAHYQSKVRKNTASRRTAISQNVVYNVTGANSRVN